MGTVNSFSHIEQAAQVEYPLSRHQKLYPYMLKQQGVSAVVVGIYSATHLREALAVGKQA